MSSSNFYEDIYAVVRLIPHGRVSTYGAIAHYLGSKKSARIIGWAMNLSHKQKIYIPAHRVVNRKGLLTGKKHFDTPDTMQLLLEAEGIVVMDNQIEHFEQVFWDPNVHLSI